jgi:hypothetical protein
MSKIFHLDEIEEFFGSEQWKLQIDVSDLWNSYKKGEKTLQTFNAEYIQRLNKYQKQINELGNDVWNDINKLIQSMNGKTDSKDLYPIYESIYDWADKHDVLIKTS